MRPARFVRPPRSESPRGHFFAHPTTSRSAPTPYPIENEKVIKRELHRFSIPRPEVVIGNNAALFATHDSLLKHGKGVHPELTIIKPDFWMDNVHESYHSLEWGQTVRALPRSARKILKDIDKNYPEDKFLTWGDYIKLRNHIIEELKTKFKVRVIPGTPTIKRLGNNDYKISVVNGDSIVTLTTSANTFFYNWFNVPRIPPYPFSNRPPHAELYQLPRSKVPERIILLGNGLSVVWVAKHFPNAEVACIKKSFRDNLPNIPSNKDVDLSRIRQYAPEDIMIAQSTDPQYQGDLFILYDKKDEKMENPLFSGILFYAIGYQHDLSITEKVFKDSKMEPKPRPIPQNLDNAVIEDLWIAPSNVPIGGLIESYMLWMEMTNNYDWAFENGMYHPEIYQAFFRAHMSENNIDLSDEFFDKLGHEIKKLSNPLDKKDEIKLITNVFVKTMRPDPKTAEEFKLKLQEMQKQQYIDGEPEGQLEVDIVPKLKM